MKNQIAEIKPLKKRENDSSAAAVKFVQVLVTTIYDDFMRETFGLRLLYAICNSCSHPHAERVDCLKNGDVSKFSSCSNQEFIPGSETELNLIDCAEVSNTFNGQCVVPNHSRILKIPKVQQVWINMCHKELALDTDCVDRQII